MVKSEAHDHRRANYFILCTIIVNFRVIPQLIFMILFGFLCCIYFPLPFPPFIILLRSRLTKGQEILKEKTLPLRSFLVCLTITMITQIATATTVKITGTTITVKRNDTYVIDRHELIKMMKLNAHRPLILILKHNLVNETQQLDRPRRRWSL